MQSLSARYPLYRAIHELRFLRSRHGLMDPANGDLGIASDQTVVSAVSSTLTIPYGDTAS